MTGIISVGAAALLAAIQAAEGAPAKAAPRMPAIDALFKVNYELVDDIIATVQKDAITRSDLDRQAAVTLIKAGGPQALAAMADPETVKKIKDMLIERFLVLQEIRRQPGATQRTSEEEARSEVKRFAARFPDMTAYQQFLAATDMSEEALKEILVRDLRFEAYIKAKVQQAAPVSEDKVREFFNENAGQFPGKKFEDLAPQIRAALTEQEFLEKFIKDLRGKYDVVDHLEPKK